MMKTFAQEKGFHIIQDRWRNPDIPAAQDLTSPLKANFDAHALKKIAKQFFLEPAHLKLTFKG
jgi:hypothetical protein